ncbi:MAG: hypothetical protein COZ06_00825 [Armatimonadetes bacterium CG_4_10_14_3_um_filter_66_18]|nr:hypothetical protein [Armatimonadota bacterium]PIX49869.1 MAG: hypothetical protein COZ57_01845 [Armatimonadetes bacterium CG_4_8_14_3_um_filter_66_20]PIY53983.1 MAG: hypothetical protein COZ06_00825 [Armatimonadetes bacterium CG_4_10_14_3_um_filter_66_18]PIZ46845.1 MAG: hypothetical protein COY42_09835 [Armatimonadetes bacterium CG_4_10_14_0_8_um_filter_66_14]PJB64884.1 MAG: hypothetical protein CO096_19290 [Armatimonadetes bacterium CG_4_9_14_3_um_filter_66_14]
MKANYGVVLLSACLANGLCASVPGMPEYLRKHLFERAPFVNLDRRLDVEASLEEGTMTAGEALGRLAQATHVNLTADASLVDRSLFCAVSAHRLGDVLETIAADCSAGWQVVAGETATSYRLVADARSPLGYWEGQFRERVKNLLEARTFPDSEVRRLMDRDPQFAVQLLVRRTAVDCLAQLTDSQLQELFDCGVVWLPKERLSAGQRELYDTIHRRTGWVEEAPGLSYEYYGPNSGFQIGLWYRPGTFSGGSGDLRLESGFPMSVEWLRLKGIEATPYTRPSETRREPFPLAVGGTYGISDVLAAIAHHFGVSIICSAPDRTGRLLPAVSEAECAEEALKALRGPFGALRHVGGAWRLHGLKAA